MDDEIQMAKGMYQNEQSIRKPRFDPLSGRNFCIIVTITFFMAISSLKDFDHENSVFARTVSDVSLLASKPVSWEYSNSPSKHNGVLIMGAPMSRMSLLTSYLDEAGFRIKNKDEDIHKSLISFDTSDASVAFGVATEPLQRMDSYYENDLLLSKQDLKWFSDNIERFDVIKAKSMVKEGLSENSNVLGLIEGSEDDIEPWAWQDSQLCITLPAWIDSIHELKKNTKDFKFATVFTYRHPLEMAKKVQAKFPYISLTQGMRIWLNYNHKCWTNIVKEESMCVVQTSNGQISSDPQHEVNRVLTELDESCDIAPGPPGRLSLWGAYYRRKQMREYESKQKAVMEVTNEYSLDEISDDLVLEALGIKELLEKKSDCYFYAMRREMDEDKESNDEENGEIEEITDVEDEENNVDYEEFNVFMEFYQNHLQNEINKWIGEEAADALHQIYHLHMESKNDSDENDSTAWISNEKVNFLKDVRMHITSAYEDAMQVYCDMEVGIAFEDEYSWPQDKSFSL